MSAAGPSFLGLGALHSGATWLHQRLRRHPELCVHHVGRDYRAWDHVPQFALFAETCQQRYGAAGPGQLHGEITSAYAVLGPEEIAVVRRTSPDLRIFYLLRNPVERAWTAALLALERAGMEPREASDAWFADVFRSRASRAHGDYADRLRCWGAQFPPGRFHVLVADDVRERPSEALRGLCRHLGVSEPPATGESTTGLEPDGEAPLPSRLRRVLCEVYRDPVRDLARELGRDLDHWLASD